MNLRRLIGRPRNGADRLERARQEALEQERRQDDAVRRIRAVEAQARLVARR